MPQEWNAITKLIEDLIEKYEIIMVKGNHDVLLGPILKKFGDKIKFIDYFEIDDILITHGDKILPTAKKIIVIGHEHPAVSFSEKPGEKYKCLLNYPGSSGHLSPDLALVFALACRFTFCFFFCGNSGWGT